MSETRTPWRALGLLLGCLMMLGCQPDPVFTEPQVLGGETIEPDVLEQGRHVYRRYCASCHGVHGDGRGVASFGQVPAPRDFRRAKFKFTGVQDRGLPSDEELSRVITQGLGGTYMRAWILQPQELHAVVQYIKTFSIENKGFRSKRLKVKPPTIMPNPFQTPEQVAAAIQKGEELYHASFQCSSCHPAYVGPKKFEQWDTTMRTEAPYDSIPKWSENYRTVLMPPDFLRHEMRAIRSTRRGSLLDHRLVDLYRTIAFGLQGPMPGYVHLGESDVWAVALYVKQLLDNREREGKALRKTLLATPSPQPTPSIP